MVYVLVFLLGIVVAAIGVLLLSAGNLTVYIPNDVNEPPYLGLKLTRTAEFVCKKKYVLFKVDMQYLNSQG